MEREHEVVFECPGCGVHVTVRSTRMARIDWDAIVDGRFIGWATCAHEEDEEQFAFIFSGETSTNVVASTTSRRVHEWSRGGPPQPASVRQ